MTKTKSTEDFSGKRQSKDWCFTLNNYTEAEEAKLQELPCTYLIYGREVGESGTPHLQGFIQYPNRKRHSSVKQDIPRAHWEARRGTPTEAAEYCRKDGDVIERGAMVSQGARSDLIEIRDLIKAGRRPVEIAESHFTQFCQYRRAFDAYAALLDPPRARPELRVVLLVGPTGTGKTSTAFSAFPDAYITVDPTLTWFDGYEGQDTVIIDDFDARTPRATLLRILDIYPVRVPVKGGFRAFNPSRIIVTTNFDPTVWEYEQKEAILRRFWARLDFNAMLKWDDQLTRDVLRLRLLDALK